MNKVTILLDNWFHPFVSFTMLIKYLREIFENSGRSYGILPSVIRFLWDFWSASIKDFETWLEMTRRRDSAGLKINFLRFWPFWVIWVCGYWLLFQDRKILELRKIYFRNLKKIQLLFRLAFLWSVDSYVKKTINIGTKKIHFASIVR